MINMKQQQKSREKAAAALKSQWSENRGKAVAAAVLVSRSEVKTPKTVLLGDRLLIIEQSTL
jgi:hypothetical protein